MNITNNYQPIRTATYQKPLIFINGNESNRSSRTNSLNQNKPKNLPIVYNSPNQKNIPLSKIPKSEMLNKNNNELNKQHFSQQKDNQYKELVYPPPLPSKEFQKVIVKPSNKEFIVNNSRPHSKSSHHRGSSIQNRPQRSVSSNYSNFGHQQYNYRKPINLPQRERTSSSYSSKSSTKIIIQTVRPLQTGSNNIPLVHSIHHTFQTQFSNPRKNYHFQDQKESLNHQFTTNHEFRVNNNHNVYRSPQNNRHFFHSPPPNQNFINKNINLQQSNFNNRTNAKKVQFSEVFQYPLKKSTEMQNRILQVNQSQITNRYTKNTFNEQQIKNYPINAQSKIYQNENIARTFIDTNENNNPNKRQREPINQIFNSKTQNNTTQAQTNRDYYYDPKTQVKRVPVQTITNKEVFNSETFYQASRRMIDKIFQAQTQKAMLRMRSFDTYNNSGHIKKARVQKYVIQRI